MAQNKMEKKFRQKLEAREIEPSANAWDRLDAMLTVAEEKKQKPVFKLNWLYIAAGFIGILLMATIFFRQSDKNAPTENGVVIENKQIPAYPANENSNPTKSLMEKLPVVNEAVAETPKPDSQKQKSKSEYFKQISTPKEVKLSNESIAVSEVKTQSEPNQKPTIKAPEVNVDELLASVDSKHKNFQKPQVKVDAGSLLSQVDGEIELSFREKVIRTVSKNYKNVKVALANRNQE